MRESMELTMRLILTWLTKTDGDNKLDDGDDIVTNPEVEGSLGCKL